MGKYFNWKQDGKEKLAQAIEQGNHIIITGQTAVGKATILEEVVNHILATGEGLIVKDDVGKFRETGLDKESIKKGLKTPVSTVVVDELNQDNVRGVMESVKEGKRIVTTVHASEKGQWKNRTITTREEYGRYGDVSKGSERETCEVYISYTMEEKGYVIRHIEVEIG